MGGRGTWGLALLLPLALLAALLGVVAVDEPANCAGLPAAQSLAEPVAVANNTGALDLRVATWNTYMGNATSKVIAGVKDLGGHADVISLQEMTSSARRDAVADELRKDGWVSSQADSGAIRIMWRASKYLLLAEGTQQSFALTRVENAVSGTMVGPRLVQWVQLQDRGTGGVFFVVNHHIIPSVEQAGHPDPATPKRVAVYKQQMAALIAVVTSLRGIGPVAVTGDFNIDARRDTRANDPEFPYAIFTANHMASNWTTLGMPPGGTHADDRVIDWIVATRDWNITGDGIGDRNGSDHNPVTATITRTATDSPHPTEAASRASSSSRGRRTATTPTPATTSASTATPISSATATLDVPDSLDAAGTHLDADQLAVAATAIAEGKAAGIPERGWVIAVAAALQESGLHNLVGGHLDSAGVWQQRPSAGWGTVAQIRDVARAAQAFYGVAAHTSNPGLLDIPGWEAMTLTQAAQAVQHSAFPDAYAKWEPAATVVVDALASGTLPGTGEGGEVGCIAPASNDLLTGDCPPTNLPIEAMGILTPDALWVERCVARNYPTMDPTTYTTGDPGGDHANGRAVDLMLPGWDTPTGKALGWQVANWVRSHATELGVAYVIFSDHIWNTQRDPEGWRDYTNPGDCCTPNGRHLNHVHVSVFGNRATGPTVTTGADRAVLPGAWSTPIGGGYQVGCGIGCYDGHAGQDFPAVDGTPVYAAGPGTVTTSESVLPNRQRCTQLPICGTTRVSYGNQIVIDHGGGITTQYAHLSARLVPAGAPVRAGQLIGYVGHEGHVKPPGPGGAHLHFEVRLDGRAINPMPYLASKGANP